MKVIWLALWGICGVLCAQSVNPVALTYSDRGFRLDEYGSPSVDIQMESRSPKPARAIALMVMLRDGEGKTARSFTHWIGMTLPGQPPALAPGGKRTYHLPLMQLPDDPSLARHTLELRVDYVRFADGSDWGLDKTRSSFYFSGFETGARFQRQHLLELLQREGEAAVRKYLEASR